MTHSNEWRRRLWPFLLLIMLFSAILSTHVFAADQEWEMTIETADGTWKTGSRDNTVGFDSSPHSLLILDNTYLNMLDDPEEYEMYVYAVKKATLTANGSVRLNKKHDLYVYNGIAYNSNGAAYKNGRFFTVSWKQITVSSSGDGLGGGSGDILNPLSYTQNVSFTDSDSIKGIAADIYGLLLVLSAAGMVFSFILAGVKVAAHGTKVIKSELIDVIGAKICALFVIFSIVGLFGIFGTLFKWLADI